MKSFEKKDSLIKSREAALKNTLKKKKKIKIDINIILNANNHHEHVYETYFTDGERNSK